MAWGFSLSRSRRNSGFGSLRFYLGQQLLLTQQRPLQELIEPKPAVLSSALKRKSKPPRIYNLGGRPALSAAT
jgi:hypothetical protein